MAGCTIGGKRQVDVVRVSRLVEIIGMAGRTVGGSALIAICVAFDTVQRGMGSRQCKVGQIVIETIIPIARRVAGQTRRVVVNIPTHFIVFVVCFGVGMTNGTTEHSVIGGVGVAIGTLVPFPLVRTAVNRKEIAIVVFVLSRYPIRVDGVALDAIGGEV
jgi:hypothetical protein